MYVPKKNQDVKVISISITNSNDISGDNASLRKSIYYQLNVEIKNAVCY